MHKYFSMILLMVMLSGSACLWAGVKTDVVIYHTPLDYRHSEFREYSHITGFYTYLGFGLKHSLEVEVDRSQLNYRGGLVFKQWDISAAHTFYRRNFWQYRVGAHFISSDDPLTDKSYTLFASVGRAIPYQWQAHLAVYAGIYNDYFPKLQVIQASPRMGIYIGNRIKSGLFLQSQLHFIHLNNRLNFRRKYFVSLEESISYFIKNYTLKIYGWTGEQAFAVQQQGLLVYNTAELYRGGYGSNLSIRFGKKMTFTAGAYAQIFSDYDKTNDATVAKYIAMLGYHF